MLPREKRAPIMRSAPGAVKIEIGLIATGKECVGCGLRRLVEGWLAFWPGLPAAVDP